MWKMIVRRILILIPQLFVITIVTFLLGNAMPGDALSGMIDPTVTAEELAHQRELLGLNDPLPVRYLDWITSIIFEGDFGQSFTHRRPVLEVIGERASTTFWLSLMILILTYAIAIPLGVIAGRYKGMVIDKAILLYIFIALSMPTLVLGILNILFFSHNLGWFPSGGSASALVIASGTPLEVFLNRIHHMILPAMTGAILGVVGIVFMLRANIIDRTYSEYVKLAKSKGVPTGVIFRRHIFRNSIIPLTAGLGFAIVGTLTGVLFIEMIFFYPGMGMLFFNSISSQDFAVVNTLIMIFSALSAIGMLISDILLTIVDPRIRVQ
ncbi:MAG: ABC transporter permease [Defluviitaleaceae bacterium]|nr:ABC transporter permease [Defluviitaleaceae bacterium]